MSGVLGGGLHTKAIPYWYAEREILAGKKKLRVKEYPRIRKEKNTEKSFISHVGTDNTFNSLLYKLHISQFINFVKRISPPTCETTGREKRSKAKKKLSYFYILSTVISLFGIRVMMTGSFSYIVRRFFLFFFCHIYWES